MTQDLQLLITVCGRPAEGDISGLPMPCFQLSQQVKRNPKVSLKVLDFGGKCGQDTSNLLNQTMNSYEIEI